MTDTHEHAPTIGTVKTARKSPLFPSFVVAAAKERIECINDDRTATWYAVYEGTKSPVCYNCKTRRTWPKGTTFEKI